MKIQQFPLDIEKKSAIPDFQEIKQIREEIAKREYPKEELCQILESYNREIGNDGEALDNIVLLKKPDSFCVITGQQLGFMSGPIYTILKAISTLHLSRQLGAIPIFWLASEDHDITEINHTTVIDCSGNLKKFTIPFPKGKFFVEDLTLTQNHIDEIKEFFHFIGFTKPFQIPCIKEGARYASVMAQILATLFKGTGLIFIEPIYLRKLGKYFLRREIERADEIVAILHRSASKIQEKGQTPVLSSHGGTNLFYKSENGHRLKIQRESTAFFIEKEKITQSELLLKVEEEPERFSTNVAARPLLQSILFPTAAYVAGPTERLYLEQLRQYHEFYHVPMPSLIPRISATFIPQQAAQYLEKVELSPQELLTHFIKRGEMSLLEKPGREYHLLRNLLFPHKKLQERVLNWLAFEALSPTNLITSFLEQIHESEQTHYLCYL